jgi:hypothetical protein
MDEIGMVELLIFSSMVALYFIRDVLIKDKSLTEEYRRIQNTFQVPTSGKMNEDDWEMKNRALLNLTAKAAARIANTLIILTGLVLFLVIFFVASVVTAAT